MPLRQTGWSFRRVLDHRLSYLPAIDARGRSFPSSKLLQPAIQSWYIIKRTFHMYPKDTNKDDNFDDEAEALKRYPFLFDESIPADEQPPEPPIAPAEEETATNYHYLDELSDELLPTLDFHRFDNLFSAKPGNAFLRDAPQKSALKKLFSDFWHEGELSILFADTGRGKSVLAVQIARSIALGEPIAPFELEVPAQRVVYFDFELTDDQFALRYTKSGSPRVLGGVDAASADGVVKDVEDSGLPFNNNFIRCPPRTIDEIPPEYKDYSEFLTNSLVEFIRFSRAKVVVVDNITWLNTSIESSAPALRLMKALHTLKREFGLSILVLAHTPKRHLGSAITVNHLQGSKMLANFADNIFAIGSSFRSRDLRYLKHIKARSGALRYDAVNVPIIRLEKPSNFLGFTFVEFARERDQMDWYRDPHFDRSGIIARVHQLSAQGLTQRQIAAQLSIGPATVNRYLRINGV